MQLHFALSYFVCIVHEQLRYECRGQQSSCTIVQSDNLQNPLVALNSQILPFNKLTFDAWMCTLLRRAVLGLTHSA